MTTILVTACGAPGAARLLRALRENGEREVRLVGVDMSERAIGRHLCDAFHLVPPGADPTFPDALLKLVEQEGVDVVLPESSHDLRHLAPRRGEFPVPVMICGPEAERRSNDKGETFAAMQRIGVGAPEFRRVTGAAGVEEAARELGYPDNPVCFKPVFSSGSRGFRVLDPSVDRTHQLLNERPGALAMRLEEAVELLPEDGLDLLVMEFLTEPERTVDGIADGSRIVLQATRTRESVRCGLGMYFVTLDAPELVAASERVVAEFGLEWFFSIQFMGEKVIEINPRISTMMIQEDFNLPWLAVKRALGEASDDELRGAAGSRTAGPHRASFLRPGGIRSLMDWKSLQETLAAACEEPDEETAERAVRAAELVAATSGEPPDDLSPEDREWAETHGIPPTRARRPRLPLDEVRRGVVGRLARPAERPPLPPRRRRGGLRRRALR